MSYIHSKISWGVIMGWYAPPLKESNTFRILNNELMDAEDKLDTLTDRWLQTPWNSEDNGYKNEIYNEIRNQRKIVATLSIKTSICHVKDNIEYYKYMVANGVLSPFHYIPEMSEWVESKGN